MKKTKIAPTITMKCNECGEEMECSDLIYIYDFGYLKLCHCAKYECTKWLKIYIVPMENMPTPKLNHRQTIAREKWIDEFNKRLRS